MLPDGNGRNRGGDYVQGFVAAARIVTVFDGKRLMEIYQRRTLPRVVHGIVTTSIAEP